MSPREVGSSCVALHIMFAKAHSSQSQAPARKMFSLTVALLGLSQQAFTSGVRGRLRPAVPAVRRAPCANPSAVVAPEPPPPEPLADLSGATLNEEQKVTVTYSGSAASRERRVRRTRRPPQPWRLCFLDTAPVTYL